jgi:hypothetical protein
MVAPAAGGESCRVACAAPTVVTMKKATVANRFSREINACPQDFQSA